MSGRPAWDDIWLEAAFTIAKRSLCDRAQVGAVIVNPANVVVSQSYNGPPPGFPHLERNCLEWCDRARSDPRELDVAYRDCPSTHAEMNAMARADRSECAGATIYVSGAVCLPCAKVIPQTGIVRVIHCVHTSDVHRHPSQVEEFLRLVGITVERRSLHR